MDEGDLDCREQAPVLGPPDFARGFVVTGEDALFSCKCTEYYAPEYDGSTLWNDLEIGIEWPVETPAPFGKNGSASRLVEISTRELPQYCETTLEMRIE